MKSYLLMPLAACASLLAGCSDTEQFRVNGEIAGKPTMNIRVNYYAGGAARSLVTAARDGKFEFFASAPQPTIVDITDYEYRPLARLYAMNGETFDIKVDRAEPLKASISGNETTERWAAFLNDNAEVLRKGGAETNRLVESYIAANPADVVSSLLLLTSYDSSENPFAADSLLSLIAPEARPSGILDGYTALLQRLVVESVDMPVEPFYYDVRDTARCFDPAGHPVSIIAFTDDTADDYDTVSDSLEKACRSGRAVYDFRAIGTRGITYVDSLKRVVGRLPGGLAARGVDRLGIPSLPFYIVTDTAGTQFYRDRHLRRATEVADSLSRK